MATIAGTDGNDNLHGGLGDDILEGGLGDDRLRTAWGEGNDTLKGGLGNDGFNVGLLGASGVQTVWVFGGGGDDSIYMEVAYSPGAGFVIVSGGAGQETYHFIMDSQWHHVAAGLIVTDFQAGTDGDRIDLLEMLKYSGMHGRGYQGGNAFDANQGYLRLIQRGANTLLQYDEDGAAGTAFGWHTAIKLRGVDRASLTAENLDGLPPDGSSLPGQVLAGPGYPVSVEGTFFDDTITGSGTMDIMQGGGGNDWMEGGDEPSDANGDMLYGGPGRDTLIGGFGNDYLDGETGDDRLKGDAGDDTLVLEAGEGNDTLAGGDGNDRFRIWLGDSAGAQVPRIRGDAGNDLVEIYVPGNTFGGDDAAVVVGGLGDDSVSGGSGADTVSGGSGADMLSGGGGADELRGGAGSDVFAFNAVADSAEPLDERDRILDFKRADGDKIDLHFLDAVTGTAGDEAFTFLGQAEFSSADASGQLRFVYDAGRNCLVLYGSVDADSDAEFAIELAGVDTLDVTDLVL